MDRTQLCGSCDVGSIPTERTITKRDTFKRYLFLLYGLLICRNRTVGASDANERSEFIATLSISTKGRGDSVPTNSLMLRTKKENMFRTKGLHYYTKIYIASMHIATDDWFRTDL